MALKANTRPSTMCSADVSMNVAAAGERGAERRQQRDAADERRGVATLQVRHGFGHARDHQVDDQREVGHGHEHCEELRRERLVDRRDRVLLGRYRLTGGRAAQGHAVPDDAHFGLRLDRGRDVAPAAPTPTSSARRRRSPAATGTGGPVPLPTPPRTGATVLVDDLFRVGDERAAVGHVLHSSSHSSEGLRIFLNSIA